jgi:hypothetical protein
MFDIVPPYFSNHFYRVCESFQRILFPWYAREIHFNLNILYYILLFVLSLPIHRGFSFIQMWEHK